MTDTLQFGIFVAVLIAFVFVGCLATRAPKKTPKLTRRKNKPARRGAGGSLPTWPSCRTL